MAHPVFQDDALPLLNKTDEDREVLQKVDTAGPKAIGRSLPRVDGREKVTGAAVYTMDMAFPRMLHAKLLRSPIAHGKILSINLERALTVPGVRAILTAKDVPDLRKSLAKDMPLFAVEEVNYVGEPIAAVAAEDPESADQAVELIDVKYQNLPALFDPDAAASADPGIVLHPNRMKFLKENKPLELDPRRPNVAGVFKAVQGDAEGAIGGADLVVENTFSTSPTHAFHMESVVSIAAMQPDGSITIWASHQAPHALRLEVAEALGISPSLVRVIVPYVGGGFGNKMRAFADVFVAFLTLRTRRPVKLAFTREEAMIASSVKYPFKVRIKDGVKRDGTIVGRQVRAIANGGAYSLQITVPRNALFSGISTYNIPNLDFEIVRVFTNQIPSNSYRGFGAAQVCWAIECQMDEIAHRLELDPVALRAKNLFREGDTNPVGEVLKDKHEAEYLKRAAALVGWPRGNDAAGGKWRRGVGISLSNKLSTDPGSTAYVRLRDDGIVEAWMSATELGQGTYTAVKQIVAEELGIEPSTIRVVTPDTGLTPFDPGVYSSHTTFSLGNALKLACDDLRQRLLKRAAKMLHVGEERLKLEGGKVVLTDGSAPALGLKDLFERKLMRFGALTETGSDFWGMGTWTVQVSHLNPSSWKVESGRAGGFYSPAAEAAEVAVNIETGQVKVLKFVVVMNVGRPINPSLIAGQVEGSVAMGLGSALHEELSISDGKILNADLKDYKLPGIADAIPVTFVQEETPHKDGPYGAKGVGEPAIVGVAPALGNAIYDAVGVRVAELPITAEKILSGLSHKISN